VGGWSVGNCTARVCDCVGSDAGAGCVGTGCGAGCCSCTGDCCGERAGGDWTSVVGLVGSNQESGCCGGASGCWVV
jgi:hypothetical protein